MQWMCRGYSVHATSRACPLGLPNRTARVTGLGRLRSAPSQKRIRRVRARMSFTFSLWVVPKGGLAKQLGTTIDDLAPKHNGPSFPPHVTLLPDSTKNQEDTIACTRRLGEKLKKYYVRFQDVSYKDIFHQCVFLLCIKDPDVMNAYKQALDEFGVDAGMLENYMPHLSLLYSDIDIRKRMEVVGEVRERFYGENSTYESLLMETGFWAENIEVWKVYPEDKTLASWEKVADFPLCVDE